MREVFAKYIKTEEFIFKYAKGMRDIIGKEMHIYNEIFFFIGGDAEFICETGKEKLLPNTVVVIPKESFHQFAVSGKEEDYCRCVLNFENVSGLDKIIGTKLNMIFSVRSEELSELFCKMRKLFSANIDRHEQVALLKAYLTEVLVLLKPDENHQYEHEKTSHLNQITSEALELIEKNLCKKIDMHFLSEKMHVSPSYLCHVFKKDLHISLHKYVLEKRLILANKKIKQSVNPTIAASECGFGDYSGFYRQYKKMFGVSPAKTKSIDIS